MILLSNFEIIELFYEKTMQSNPTEFIEVGCYEASASKHLSLKMPDCLVTAYEANPVNFAHFGEEIKKYNVTYVNSAISNFTGDTTFHLLKASKPNIKSSLSKRTKPKKSTSVTVKCNTLNNLHYKIGHTYCMWIDAEGVGYEVLEGASKILDNTKYILIEVEKQQYWINQKLDIDVISLLEYQGFEAIAKDREFSQYNILFEKK